MSTIKDDRSMAAHPPEGDGSSPRAGWLGRLLGGTALLRSGLAWSKANPRWAMLGGAGVLAASIGTIVLLALVFPSSPKPAGSLPEALALLLDGDVEAARKMAAALRDASQITYAERGGLLFILGTALAADAEEHTSAGEQELLFLVASRYLEESRLCGFPEEHEAAGLLLLGRCLVRASRPEEAIPILKLAAAANPHAELEIYDLLTRAALESQPPQARLALEFNTRYLSVPGLGEADRDVARLRQGEIHLALADPDAGRVALAEIAPQSRAHIPAVLLQARLLLLELDQLAQESTAGENLPPEVHDALVAAIAALEAIVETPRVEGEQKSQAQLLQALCYSRLDEQGKAISLLVRIRRAQFGGPLALAAAIYEADLHLSNGRSDEALKLFKRAIMDASAGAMERNVWLPKSRLEASLSAAFRRFVDTSDFARAVELARILPPLLDESLSYQWRAQAQHAWGEQLLAQAAPLPLATAEALRQEAREHFRQAAADYERLAELRYLTRYYLDDLAQSATDYLKGQGFQQAARLYRRYLSADPQTGRAEALTGLGEALLAIGQVDAAQVALAQCYEQFPKHPASYRARYLASLTQQERGKLDEARQLLVDNLYNLSLTPDSSEWRDSLFALGRLEHRIGVEAETRSRAAGVDSVDAVARKAGIVELERSHASFQEAIGHLDEAIRRYPQAEQAVEARYLLAEAHRHSAKWPRKQLDLVTIEASKAPLVRQMQENLEAAADEYGTLIDQLGDDRDGRGQTPLQQTVLRNSYFGRADALFDMGRYDEAAEAYSAATNRYQNEPEALSAYVQIAACYRRQERFSEARGTLEQARLVLERIRKDADFTRTTPYSRDDWSNLLTWLSAL